MQMIQGRLADVSCIFKSHFPLIEYRFHLPCLPRRQPAAEDQATADLELGDISEASPVFPAWSGRWQVFFSAAVVNNYLRVLRLHSVQ